MVNMMAKLKGVCPACGSKDYTYSEQGKYNKCNKCHFIWDESFQAPVSKRLLNKSGKDEDLSKEDSEGDGLVLFNDPMFPPENFDEEE